MIFFVERIAESVLMSEFTRRVSGARAKNDKRTEMTKRCIRDTSLDSTQRRDAQARQNQKKINCNAKKRFPLRVPLPLRESPHGVPSSPCPRATGRLHDKRQRRCDNAMGAVHPSTRRARVLHRRATPPGRILPS